MTRMRNLPGAVMVAAVAVAMVMLPVSASAVPFVWDGGGTNDNWTTGANWGGTAPGTGNTVEIQFAGSTRLTPNVDTNDPWVVQKILFNSGAGAFDIGGNEISLQGTGTVLQNSSSVTQTFTSDIQTVGGSKTFTASSGSIVIDGDLDLQASVSARGDKNVTVNGLISGASGRSIGRTDSGTLKLTNPNNTFSGNPGISHGVLEIASIADSGVVCAIGTGNAVRLGQGTWGPSDTGTLRYTGPTASTNRTIQMSSNGTTQSSHTLSFSGRPTLEVTDPATTLTLNGDLVYSGSSTLGQWRLRGAGTGVINGDITTAGAELDKSGTGTWVLNGTNSYGGATMVHGGVLKLGSASALGNTSGVTVAPGGTVDVNGFDANKNFTIAGSGSSGQGALVNSGGDIQGHVGVTLAADATIGITGGRMDIGIGRPLVGNGFTLTKVGAGRLPIRNAAGSFGAINIDEGLLYFETDQTGMGSTPITVAGGATVAMYYTKTINAPVTLNGGTLLHRGGGPTTTSTWSGPVTLNSTSTLSTTGGNLALTGAIGGAGGLDIVGPNMVTLSGTSSYAGPTTVNSGILRIGSADALGNTLGVTVESGATFDFNGYKPNKNFTIAGSGTSGQGALYSTGYLIGNVGVTLAADATIGVGGSTSDRLDIGIGRPLVGNGFTLTKVGIGRLPVRNGAGSFGAMQVDEGILYFETDQNGMGSTPITVASAGTVAMYYTRSINAPVTLDGGTLRHLGGGGTSTWSGPVTLNVASTLMASGGSLSLTGAIGGAGGLNIVGPNLVTLSGTSNYSGATTVSSGTLKLGSVGALGNTSGVTVASGATFDFNGFTVANTYTIAGTGTSGQGALVNTGSNVNDFQLSLTLAGDATIGGTGRIDIGWGGGTIDGGGFALTKTGTNYVDIRCTASNLSALNINEGFIYFEAGQSGMASTPINVASGAAVGCYGNHTVNAPVMLNGATLAQYGNGSTGTWTGPVTLNATSTFDTKPSGWPGGDISVTGDISGVGGLTVEGPNAVNLSGTNSYQGATTVNSGILRIGSDQALGNTSGVTVASGATFDFNGYEPNKNFTIAGTGTSGQGALYSTGYHIGGVGVTLSADATIRVDGAAGDRLDIGYGGRALNGNGYTLTKTGAAMLPIRNVMNNFGGINVDEGRMYFEATQMGMGSTPIAVASGATAGIYGNVTVNAPVVLNGGTLAQFGANNSHTGTWTGAVTLNSTSTFSTRGYSSWGGGNMVVNGPIGGAGGLNITGPHTMTLGATSSYTGATTVSQGTLLVNGSIASSPMTTVAPGATIGGTGTVGPLTINGILSPGLSPGTLGAGNTVWNGGGSYLWEIADYDGVAGIDWDLLDVAGSLAIAATPVDPFTITVSALPGGTAVGTLELFESFEIVRTTEGITGFDADSFVLDTNGINYGATNYWTITHEGNSLYLNHVPEPATLSLLAFGAMGLLARRRRK